MADFIYDKAKDKILDGSIIPTHTFKAVLLSAAHTPGKSTHETLSDVSGDEVSGVGYTAGGYTLASVSLTRSGAVVKFDAADIAVAALNPSFRYVVVYDDSHASDALLALLDPGELVVPAGAPVDIEFDPDGIFSLTDG